MPDLYRRDGTPYAESYEGFLEWERDFGDLSKKIVQKDLLENGYLVSTIWLGMDQSFGLGGPPLIFETLVSRHEGYLEPYLARYSTEDDAIIGHLKAVDLYREKPELD